MLSRSTAVEATGAILTAHASTGLTVLILERNLRTVMAMPCS